MRRYSMSIPSNKDNNHHQPPNQQNNKHSNRQRRHSYGGPNDSKNIRQYRKINYYSNSNNPNQQNNHLSQQPNKQEQNNANIPPWQTLKSRENLSGQYGIDLVKKIDNDSAYKETLQLLLKCINHEMHESEVRRNHKILHGLLQNMCMLIVQRCNHMSLLESDKSFNNCSIDERNNTLIKDGERLLDEVCYYLDTHLKRKNIGSKNDNEYKRYIVINDLFDIANNNPACSLDDDGSSKKKRNIRGLYVPALVIIRYLYDSQEIVRDNNNNQSIINNSKHRQPQQNSSEQKTLWETKFYTLYGRLLFAMGFDKNISKRNSIITTNDNIKTNHNISGMTKDFSSRDITTKVNKVNVILLANKKELELGKLIIQKITQKYFDICIVPTIYFKMMSSYHDPNISCSSSIISTESSNSSGNTLRSSHDFLNVLSIFLSLLYANSKGYILKSHLSDAYDSSSNGIAESDTRKNSLNLIGMTLNILRNNRNSNTNEMVLTTSIAIDILVILVKSCSYKALILISNLLLTELSYRGSESVYFRMILYRAFEETAMATCTTDNDNNNKYAENDIFQCVIDALSSSLQLEFKLAASNVDNYRYNVDITASTTIEATVYCEAALEAWKSLKGIITNNIDDDNIELALTDKKSSVTEWLNQKIKEKEEEQKELQKNEDGECINTKKRLLRNSILFHNTTTRASDTNLKLLNEQQQQLQRKDSNNNVYPSLVVERQGSDKGSEDDNDKILDEESFYDEDADNIANEDYNINTGQLDQQQLQYEQYLDNNYDNTESVKKRKRKRKRCIARIFTLFIVLSCGAFIVLLFMKIIVLPSNTNDISSDEGNNNATSSTNDNEYIKRQHIYSISPTLSFIEDFMKIQNKQFDLSSFLNTTTKYKENRILAMDWVLYQDFTSYDTFNNDRQLNIDDRLLLSLTQRYVLALFYYSTTNTNNTYWNYCGSDSKPSKKCKAKNKMYSKWLSSTHECTWYGISCYNDNITIYNVTIRNNNLFGTIPIEMMQELKYLKVLSLSYNYINEALPNINTKASSLQILQLDDNFLSGTISSNLNTQYPNLRGLYLQNNNLYGTIPNQIYDMKNLLQLHLHNNSFTGLFDFEFLPIHLEELDLSYNQLSGSVNDIVSLLSFNYEYLRVLKLDYNQFHGSILSSNDDTKITDSNTSIIHTLSLSNNKFIGAISSTISSLKYLRYIDLSNNYFESTLPLSIGKLKHLEFLDSYYNYLEGSIDDDICLLRDDTNQEGKLKELGADCLSIDEYDSEMNEDNALIRVEAIATFSHDSTDNSTENDDNATLVFKQPDIDSTFMDNDFNNIADDIDTLPLSSPSDLPIRNNKTSINDETASSTLSPTFDYAESTNKDNFTTSATITPTLSFDNSNNATRSLTSNRINFTVDNINDINLKPLNKKTDTTNASGTKINNKDMGNDNSENKALKDPKRHFVVTCKCCTKCCNKDLKKCITTSDTITTNDNN